MEYNIGYKTIRPNRVSQCPVQITIKKGSDQPECQMINAVSVDKTHGPIYIEGGRSHSDLSEMSLFLDVQPMNPTLNHKP
ncbi:MAG: hypothetical protein EOO47_13780 [Flavobacterium sp.]|nr:MAG: hypothetical protein EOO47_13780 [Flavobacterium sp.]